MKKLFLFVCMTLSLSLYAQEAIDEGVMSLKVTMSSDNEQMNASFAMIGDIEATTYFKKDKSCTEVSSAMMGSNTTIVDNTNKTMLMLMDNPMMGKKYMRHDIKTEDEASEDITVTENGETKTILGYECKGYDLVTKENGQEQKITMFVTDKIKAPNKNTVGTGDKIEGFPLLATVSINQNGVAINTIAEVTEIKGEKVDDSKFDLTIPEGYTEMKMPKQ